MATHGWSEPKRVRRSVHANDRHLGYVTMISYPNRDLTAFSEGSPHREIVIADEREGHVALLQRFKEHWLIQCGKCYGTTDRSEPIGEAQAMELASFTLRQFESGEFLVAVIKQQMEKLMEK